MKERISEAGLAAGCNDITMLIIGAVLFEKYPFAIKKPQQPEIPCRLLRP
ncbi:MAG: hypothetical protein GY750_01950 [Lentisphaerae bacterium]|nr:hypothetical protein [Lentisphaerota bacterium]